VAANIRDLRKLKGLTQVTLAERVGLDSTAVAKIETRKRNVSIEEAWALAGELGVSVDQLLDYPEANHDRRLNTLLLGPLRELESRGDAWRQFLNGTSEGDFQALIGRIAQGALAYLSETSDPRTPTASRESLEQALAAANDILSRHQQFRSDVEAALDRLLDSRSAPRPRTAGALRTALRASARVVTDRGETV
jgi:transcriptional regulator with XRE-family HTH domain